MFLVTCKYLHKKHKKYHYAKQPNYVMNVPQSEQTRSGLDCLAWNFSCPIGSEPLALRCLHGIVSFVYSLFKFAYCPYWLFTWITKNCIHARWSQTEKSRRLLWHRGAYTRLGLYVEAWYPRSVETRASRKIHIVKTTEKSHYKDGDNSVTPNWTVSTCRMSLSFKRD